MPLVQTSSVRPISYKDNARKAVIQIVLDKTRAVIAVYETLLRNWENFYLLDYGPY